MQRFLISFMSVLLIFVTLGAFSFASLAHARGESECRSIGVDYVTNPSPIPENIKQIRIDFTKGLKDGKYRLASATKIPLRLNYSPDENGVDASEGKASITINDSDGKLSSVDHNATLEHFYTNENKWDPYCQNVKYQVGYDLKSCKLAVSPTNPTDAEQFRINVNYIPAGEYDVKLNDKAIGVVTIGNDGTGNTIIGPLPAISKATLEIKPGDSCKIKDFVITASGSSPPRPVPSNAPPPSGSTGGANGPRPSLTLCPLGGQGIETALGCIPTENTTEFAKWFLRWAIGIAGGIAFLLILSSGFQIMTSSGNPEKLKGGQEQLTAAISGLLLIIFSVFLLRLIGVDILKLPGFGS